MHMPRKITEADIQPIADYGRQRAERRRAMAALKRDRRAEVGPYVTFYFENFATMLHQVHEMLFIEKGGAAQLPDELRAYNPLIPDGSELVATMMIEIDDPLRRARVLGQLGNIDRSIALQFAGESVAARPEADQPRTDDSGKASSVHFVHFPFTASQIAKFRAPGTQVIVSIDHQNYRHMAVLPEPVRAALAQDFD